MAVAKRQRREKPAKIEQKKVQGPRTGVRTSGKTTTLLAGPTYIGQAQGEISIKRGGKASSLSLPHALGRSSPCVFGLTCHHASKMDFPAIF